jgi:hypothetical protein
LTNPRDQQRSKRLDVAVAALGVTARTARQHRTCGLDRVELVGLPVAAPLLAVRAIHLDDRDTAHREMTGQTRPVGAGAFDTNSLHHPERTKP